ncbi:hypothetical protein ACF0H5_017499 [Mactra antiquata]
MMRILIIGVCITATLASTTDMPTTAHSTKEPNEVDTFKFVYEAHTHKMLLVNEHKCYIFTLSDSEIAGVHTDAGITAIELKLMSRLSTAVLTEVTKDSLNRYVQRSCGHNVAHYYNAVI